MQTTYKKLQETLQERPYTWLITGVAGFIGSNLLEKLLTLNQNVVGIDNFATGHKKNIQNVLKKLSAVQQKLFTFHEGDIRSLQDCKKAINKVDYVLQQAALGSVPRSINSPEITNETNVSGFLNMLVAAKDASIKRFVYASSSSVYGDSPLLPKQEEIIGKPLSPYAVSKYSNELYAAAFAKCYSLQTIGLRYFNVFGPRQDPNGPYAAVIPKWIHQLENKDVVKINGDGETTRDFCYVQNVVQANLLSATTENNEAIGKVYNVAVGERHSLNQLYHLIVDLLKLTHKPVPKYLDFRSGDIRDSLASIDLIKANLNYATTHDLKNGLIETLKIKYDENFL